MSDGQHLQCDQGPTRRRFLTGAATTAAMLATGLFDSARASTRAQPTVAVFGGGVAGLTAAHELAERGFRVSVYERRAWGGKARSIDVGGTAQGGRRPLSAEHGFRMLFAGYQNLPDTMRRIPFGSNRNGVVDNLVPVPTMALHRDGGRAPAVLPLGGLTPPLTPAEGLDLLRAALSWLPPADLAQLLVRYSIFLSSGPARRFGQWEHLTWFEFVQADRMSEGGRLAFGELFTKFASQDPSGNTSARTLAQGGEATIYPALTGRGGSTMLDAPTNEAWIDPWIAHLRRLGVDLRLGSEVTHLAMANGRIDHAEMRSAAGSEVVHADWYIVALPVDWATKLWSEEILTADPHLRRSFEIVGGWMNGIQFFLRRPTPITQGPVILMDSPWAVGGVSQAQLWHHDFPATFGDGSVHDKFSAMIVDWDTPGILYGKTAKECTRQELAAEAWAQFKAHFTYDGAPHITDDLLAGTFLDPGIRWEGERVVGNDDTLPISRPGTWFDRPSVDTAIPNLFLAGDYVKVDFDQSSMEGANEAGRRAVNALLDHAGSNESRVRVFRGWQPPEWAALRELDDVRYRLGQPNLLDADLSLDQLLRRLRRSA